MFQEEDYDADEILREYEDFDDDGKEPEEPIEELDFEKGSDDRLDDIESDLGDSGDLWE
jgi:hypothetical protein